MSISLAKKYAEALSYALVNAGQDEADEIADFFAKSIFESGLSLHSLSIIKKAEKIALNKISRSIAIIRSRESLEASLKSRLEQSVRDHFGKELVFEEKIDPSLVSGVAIELFGLKIDASVLGNSKKLLEHIKS